MTNFHNFDIGRNIVSELILVIMSIYSPISTLVNGK